MVETKTESAKPAIGEFGNGKYSAVMGELYRDSMRVIGLSNEQADRLSRRFGADMGRAKMELTRLADIKIGKSRKDGSCIVREGPKAHIVESYAITIARLIADLDKQRRLLAPVGDGECLFPIALNENLLDFVNGKTVILD